MRKSKAMTACILVIIVLVVGMMLAYATNPGPRASPKPSSLPKATPESKNSPDNQEILTLSPEVERKALHGTYLLFGPEMPVADWYCGRVFCVSKDPVRFVTAAHCVLVRKKVKIGNKVGYKTINSPLGRVWYIHHPLWKDKFLKVKLLSYDMYLDVAILGLDDQSLLPLMEFPLNDKVGEEQTLFMFGNSRDGAMDYQLLWGKNIFIIKKIDEEVIPAVEYTREWYFTYLISRPGCSGAPIFNLAGEVVGINWGRYFLNDRFYCAVTPAKYIKSVLENTTEGNQAPTEIRNKPPDLEGIEFVEEQELTQNDSKFIPDISERKSGD